MTLASSVPCKNCGKTFQPERADQEYHNRSCRRQAQNKRARIEVELVPTPQANAQADGPFAGFTAEESAAAVERCNGLFVELGRRESTTSQIQSLVTTELIHRRLQTKYAAERMNGEPNPEALQELARLETSIRRARADLGLDHQTVAKRAQVTSTPSMMISAYAQQIGRMSPEIRAQWDAEEREVLAKIQPRIQKLLDASTNHFTNQKPSSEIAGGHEQPQTQTQPEPPRTISEAQRLLDEEGARRAQVCRNEPSEFPLP